MIGKNIKQYLINNGITQTFISKKTDIPINILNSALNGKRNIYAEEYFKICEALNIPLDTFKQETSQNMGSCYYGKNNIKHQGSC